MDVRATDGRFVVGVTETRTGSTVGIDFSANGSASAGDVSFGRLDLVADADFEMRVTASDEPPTDGTGLTVDGVSPLAYLNVSHLALADEDVSNVTFRFAVSRETLDARGIAPEEVVLYRNHDGPWTALETHLVDTTDSSYVFEAKSPGLSVFAVGAPDRETTSPGTTTTTPATTEEGTTTTDEPSATTSISATTSSAPTADGTTVSPATGGDSDGGISPFVIAGMLFVLLLLAGLLYRRSVRER